jgi:hypothetical protein
MRILKKELWPVKVKIDKDEFDSGHYEIELWLGEHLGPFKGRWNSTAGNGCRYYYFRNGQDAMHFSLKWT